MGAILSYEVADERLATASSGAFDLSVLTGADRLVFLAHDGNGKVQLLREYGLTPKDQAHELIQQVYLEDELLKQPFRKTRVVFNNMRYTLLPEPFFKEHSAVNPLKSLVELQSDESAQSAALEWMQARLIYACPEQLRQTMLGLFPSAQFLPMAAAILAGFREHNRQQEAQAIYLFVDNNELHLFAFETGHLKLHNTVRFEHTNDALYFTMLFFQSAGYNTDIVPLYLSGQLIENSEVYNLLYRFIRHLHWMPLPSFFHTAQPQSQGEFHQPWHVYYPLFSARLCAS